MFPAVSGNLKAVPCFKAVLSTLSDARPPMSVLSFLQDSDYIFGLEECMAVHGSV